jgi:hypothetical protein
MKTKLIKAISSQVGEVTSHEDQFKDAEFFHLHWDKGHITMTFNKSGEPSFLTGTGNSQAVWESLFDTRYTNLYGASWGGS